MTYSFIQAVQNEPGLTYGRLLNAMRFAIREAKTGIRLKGPIASLLNKLISTDLSQVPLTLATCSSKYNTHTHTLIYIWIK